METDTTYNGWKNYETWNVVLWLDNDEYYNSLINELQGKLSYEDFIYEYVIDSWGYQTPDGVKWVDRNLDWETLDKWMKECCE